MRSLPAIFPAKKDMAIRQFPVKSSAPVITIKIRDMVKTTPPTNAFKPKLEVAVCVTIIDSCIPNAIKTPARMLRANVVKAPRFAFAIPTWPTLFAIFIGA